MGVLERLNVGLVGAVGRGGSFRAALEANGARVHAVCDLDQDRVAECMHQYGATEAYTDCAEMLEKSELDAVVVGTPMQCTCRSRCSRCNAVCTCCVRYPRAFRSRSAESLCERASSPTPYI
jgi:hypothetical protein